MKKNISLEAHGGCGIINRVIKPAKEKEFVQELKSCKSYTISDADLSVFYRIADGVLSPLEGPMGKDEFSQVLEKEVIVRDGKPYAWTIPIAFPANSEDNFKPGEKVAVKNESGDIVGSLDITDVYPFDKDKYNKSVYGTEKCDHPGPRIFNDDKRELLLGGKIQAFPQPKNPDYGKYMLGPKEVRELFKEKKWERVVAFQTRNALHRAHEYTMVYACQELTKKGIFTGIVLNPLVGALKSDDVPAGIRMKTYEALLSNKLIGDGDKDDEFWKTIDYELSDQIIMIGLDMKMFYAGPKEAIMHAIYRQNYGFTDIIIGRKHADAPFDTGEPVWGDFDAQEKFEKLKGDLKIKPFKIGFAAYFQEIDRVGLVKDFKDKGYHTVSISGKELRKKLASSQSVDERVMRKPVADILSEFYRNK